MKSYLLARAKEPSSWRGLIFMLTAIGIPVAPQLAEAVVTVGLGLAGLVGVIAPDK